MSMSTKPRSALSGPMLTDRSLPLGDPYNAQSATRTKTSRAFSMLGSTIGTVCKTAAVAAMAAPFVVVASILVPSSVYSAAASAASSIGSKIPSKAVTSTLSGAASYALKHLSSYKNAQTFNKFAIPLGGLAVWGAADSCVRYMEGAMDKADEHHLEEISRRSRETAAEPQEKAPTAKRTNPSIAMSIWDVAQERRMRELADDDDEDAGLSSMGEREGDGMEKDEEDEADEKIWEDQQFKLQVQDLGAALQNKPLELIISSVFDDVEVNGEPAI